MRPGRFASALLLVAGVCLAAVPRPAAGAPPEVMRARYASHEGNTRVVVELSRPATYRQLKLDDPPRVALDLAAEPGADLGPVSIGDGRVQRMRVGRQEEGTVRLVFDLDRVSDYRVFDLAAAEGQPDRVVLDFFGSPAPHGSPPEAGNRAPAAGEAPAEPPEPPVRRAVVREPPAKAGPILVVIDAGHGGQDPGSIGHGAQEKAICLAISRKLEAELNKRPGFKARLTRDDDIFIPLRRRIELADKQGADAFVSIHCNAAKNTAARGTEVYYLSLSGATDEASKELARLENAADLMGGVAPEADDDLSSILFDMQQTEVLQRGAILAESVVNALRSHPQLKTRGVKQAGFVVLKSPRIPSILVEAAFITNPQENKLLRSAEFQAGFSRRVADGVVRYFESLTLAGLR